MPNPQDVLVFEMGLYKATFPKHLLYSEIHFWFLILDDDRCRCGLSAYAARLLTDLFRVEWKFKEGDTLAPEQLLGEVESTKASSELYSPVGGKVLAINQAVVEDPSIVGLDPYEGWLFEIQGVPANPMTPEEYVAFLAAGWEETVKMLKGQV